MSGQLAAVVGWPVAQSLSPIIHNYWLKQHGIDGVYIALPVAPENFNRCVTALPLMGFAGVNVTVPHKPAAAHLADELDEDATITRAVNLLVFRDDRTLGSNTDVRGFGESLREAFAFDISRNGPVVVLGAGGAARGVILALHKAGFREVRICNRTKERAEMIADDLGGVVRCRVVDWGDWATSFDSAQLLVNTTSLGMRGKPPLQVPLDCLPGHTAVADIVYNPVQTSLLREAERTGHPVMDGLGMLMHQAAPAFAAWFGVKPAVTPELRALLLRALAGG